MCQSRLDTRLRPCPMAKRGPVMSMLLVQLTVLVGIGMCPVEKEGVVRGPAGKEREQVEGLGLVEGLG